MSSFTQEHRKAAEAYSAARQRETDFRAELRSRRKAEFKAAGGCPECRGRGWVVTWDTLDCMDGSCHDSGGCRKAKSNPAAHGENAPYDHSYASKYDKLHGERVELIQTPAEARELESCQREAREAQAAMFVAEVAATPAEGKGRKVPKGTEGRVFWTGRDRYDTRRTRVGLETAEGKRHFCDSRFVEVIAA